MSRDEQIEEMANAILYQGHYDTCCKDDCETIASLIYNKGYRKSTDLAEEIFAEIENLFLNNHIESFKSLHNNWNYRFKVNMMTELAELKKKYTEGGNEQDG